MDRYMMGDSTWHSIAVEAAEDAAASAAAVAMQMGLVVLTLAGVVAASGQQCDVLQHGGCDEDHISAKVPLCREVLPTATAASIRDRPLENDTTPYILLGLAEEAGWDLKALHPSSLRGQFGDMRLK
eukprot:2047926-Amphidinium_carterae.2